MNMRIEFYCRCFCIAMLFTLGGHRVSAQGNFHLVKDIEPGADDMSITEMRAIGEYVYFTDSEHGLIRTDGSKDGTIVIEYEHSLWYTNYTATQGGFYFRVQNWVNNTYTIRKTNGQIGASVVVSPTFVSAYNLIEINGILYFVADDGVHGREIWKYDGVSASMVKDIGNSSSSFDPYNLKEFNSMLFFVADDGVHGAELWKTDGTESGTVMIKDIYSGKNGGFPSGFEVLNNELYFNANDGINGQELWKTDGSENGTVLVKDIETGFDGSAPLMLTRAGNAIYFEAYDKVHGRALWKTLGTSATTSLVIDMNPAVDIQSYISSLTAVNNVLYFAANDGVHGRELWKNDGSGANMLKEVIPGNVDGNKVKNFTSYNNHLFFVADGQLWKSDGNACNTVQMTSADGVSYVDWLPYLVGVGDKIFLQATTPSTGEELFYYDYSTGGPKGVCTQSVDMNDIGSKTYGDDPFIVTAVADSGLPVVFSSNDPNVATIDGNTVTITGAGEVTITATQEGDANYAPAFTGKQIVIGKKDQTITFDALPGKIFGEAPFSIAAISSSGLPVSFSSANDAIASVNDNMITLHGPGEVVITAIQNGNNNYLAAAPVTQTLAIKVITAIEPGSVNSVSVYPNPVIDHVTVQGFSISERIRVLLYRVDGKVINTEELSGKRDYQIDMSSLTPGAYVITITSANGTVSERIIKK